ncbi:MAG: hypothetical protein K2W96_05955 [Gemmataceae bacterium]|nr:hypothetical protein [Gemmataceae bacterium]
MITAEEIRQRVKAEPFVPFRIRTSFGQVQDVVAPKLVLVGQDFVAVGTPCADDPLCYDTMTQLSIPHITAVEELAHAVK